MAKKVYLKRYAQAVFELALEKNELDRWHSDLQKLVTVTQNRALVAALASPKIRLEEKIEILSELVTGISPLALNLASILISRGRFSMVGDIAEDYRRLVNRHRGIEQADVVTAVPLDNTDKQMLVERFSILTGKHIMLKSTVDSGVLGGMIVKVGGKLLDGSTRSKLAALKNALGGTG